MKKSLALMIGLIGCLFSRGQASTDSAVLHFASDSSSLDAVAKTALEESFRRFESQHAQRLVIVGHCDSRGSEAYNDALSRRRVESVRSMLVLLGLDANQIVSMQGMGEKMPLNDNATETGRQANRRVELRWEFEKTVSVTPPKPIDTVVTLTQVLDTAKEGSTIRLRNINFYGGRHIFLPEAQPALEELLAAMKANPTLKIEIQGHICCFAVKEDGMDFDTNRYELSKTRALAVYAYLVRNGIEENRMRYVGYAGQRLLISPERSEADRTTNRRVEILILSR